MKWNEIDLIVSPEATDLVALLLYECGGSGSIIHDDEADELGRIRITAYFPPEQKDAVETVRTHMRELARRDAALGKWQIRTNLTDDTDWLYSWQAYFHPKKISEHFWAAPAWEPAEPGEGEDVIIIEPGLAFGSGFHDTTCMCVQYLEQAVKPGAEVFDIGTGTGILAVAAAKLGAKHVVAVDFDEKAVSQAVINANLNNVSDVVDVYNSDLLAAVSAEGKKADVVVANLVTNAVLALLPTLPPYMEAGGILIASGIIDERIGEVRRAAGEAGFAWEDECLQNGWYAVRMRRL